MEHETNVNATLEDALWSLYDHAGVVCDPAKRAPFRRLSLKNALEMLSKPDAADVPRTLRASALAELAHRIDGQLPLHYGKLRREYEAYAQLLFDPGHVDPTDEDRKSVV